MKRYLFLEKPTEELEPNELHREHATIHLYFLKMTRNPIGTLHDPFWGTLDPALMFIRHGESVEEMLYRNGPHLSEIPDTQFTAAQCIRSEYMLAAGQFLGRHDEICVVEESRAQQLAYALSIEESFEDSEDEYREVNSLEELTEFLKKWRNQDVDTNEG